LLRAVYEDVAFIRLSKVGGLAAWVGGVVRFPEPSEDVIGGHDFWIEDDFDNFDMARGAGSDFFIGGVVNKATGVS